MIIEIKKISSQHIRTSNRGTKHTYLRTKTVIIIKCDNCSNIFQRDLGKMDHRRLNNNYFHVCSDCNSKQFAQRIGVDRRRLWDIAVDKDIDISRF